MIERNHIEYCLMWKNEIKFEVEGNNVFIWVCTYGVLIYKPGTFDNCKHIEMSYTKLYLAKLLGTLVLNALQLRTLFDLFNFFGFNRHWWVFCRRNARLAYIQNLVLVSMISVFTITGSMPLLVEIYFASPVVSTFLCWHELSLIWLYL